MFLCHPRSVIMIKLENTWTNVWKKCFWTCDAKCVCSRRTNVLGSCCAIYAINEITANVFVTIRVVKLLLCAYYYYYYFIYLNSLLLLLLLLHHIFKQPITITITRKYNTAYYYYYYFSNYYNYFPDYYYYFPILLLLPILLLPHSITLPLNQTNTTQTDYKDLYYFFASLNSCLPLCQLAAQSDLKWSWSLTLLSIRSYSSNSELNSDTSSTHSVTSMGTGWTGCQDVNFIYWVSI